MDELVCNRCGKEFDELNEYNLCADCEKETLKEIQSELDTQISLNKQFY